MEVDFRPTRTRGTGGVLLDVIIGMVVLATVVIAVLTFVDNAAEDRLARAYAEGGPQPAPAPSSAPFDVPDGLPR